MNQLNADFLEQIANSFGDNAQFSAPPLSESLVPVVMADLYRSKDIHFFDGLTPSGAASQATLSYPGDALLQTRVYVGEFGVAAAGNRTSISMQTTFSVGPSSGFITVGQAIVPAGDKQVVCGPMAWLDKNSPMGSETEQRPFEIVIPPGESLFLTLKNDEGGLLAAEFLSWHFVGRTEAPAGVKIRTASEGQTGF